MTIFNNILETIGRTPVVRIQKLQPPHINLYVKLEAFNPLGSVKDRLALGIIEAAERDGSLRPGQTVVEATSGNTGIGLAMVCAQKGYPLVIVMAENFSVERRKLMRFLGAKVVLTPAWAKGTGMLEKAAELANTHGWFLCRQFENEANADVHSRTTARELLDDFAGMPLDYWVTGAGTGGTLKGVARVLREHRPETQVIVCEPDNSPLLGSGVVQARRADGSPAGSHAAFRPHLVQGWSPDFIPKLSEDALAQGLCDRIVPVNSAEALRLSRELAQREGIFTGISGGATFAAALTVCETAKAGSTVVCMLPDTGERYLSTPLFENVLVDMSAEEFAISNSTASCRWGAAPAAVPPAPVREQSAADAALLRPLLDDPARPVVLIAFAWCEFCWSVRKLFARAKIPFQSIDIDSPELQKNGLGAQIRAAASARTGSQTIPQVFVGGQFIGGATETLDAFAEGRLQHLLAHHHVVFDEAARFNPHELLPSWILQKPGARGAGAK